MQQQARAYILITIVSAVLTSGIVMAFNLFVDPYGSYRLIETAAKLQSRPAVYRRVKLAKAYDVRRIKPEAIILGTSRSHVALRMTHGGWSVPLSARYNDAFDGATTKEMYAYLLHAQAVHPLRQVVLGLDSWQLGRGPAWTRPDFDQTILFEPGRPLHNASVYAADLSLLISTDTTSASIAEIRGNNSEEPQWLAPDGQRLGDIFFREVEPRYSISPGAYFRNVDRQEIAFTFDTGPALTGHRRTMPPSGSQPGLTSFDYIEKIVSFCREHSIDLQIFITPAHANQLEIAALLGNWPTIERGKRDLVNLLAQDAESHSTRPVPLYDFCGYSSVTTEEVPPAGSRAEMKYYWDSSHFKQEVGDWILDRLFGTASKDHPVPEDFGVLLTPTTIDAALRKIRVEQAVYRDGHVADIKEIESMVEQVKNEIAARAHK
jgi:hypothetical protein